MINKLREQLIDQTNQFTHHAFWLRGEPAVVTLTLRNFLEEDLAVNWTDIMLVSNSSFVVDDSRLVKTFTGGALLGTNRFLIVSFNQINLPAQQALLKVLEEPPAGLIIFLVTPAGVELIPTVNSRLLAINLDKLNNQKDLTGQQPNFLHQTMVARLSGLGKLLDQTATPAEGKQVLNQELTKLEQELNQNLTGLKPAAATAAKQIINQTKTWLKNSPQVSVRLLADYLAGNLPRL